MARGTIDYVRPEDLTDEEFEKVKRVVLRMPHVKACHVNYLLNLGKCSIISEYIEKKKQEMKETQKKDSQYMNINRYMDKKSYIIPAPKKPKKKGKKDQHEYKNENAQFEYYTP